MEDVLHRFGGEQESAIIPLQQSSLPFSHAVYICPECLYVWYELKNNVINYSEVNKQNLESPSPE